MKTTDKPKGASKYERKVAKRREAAKQLGLPRNATWPEINAERERQEAAAWEQRQT